jgi:hypothetical protein
MYGLRRMLVGGRGARLLALLVGTLLLTGTPLAVAPAALAQEEPTLDTDDPYCTSNPRITSEQQAREFEGRCILTPEEKERKEKEQAAEPEEAILPQQRNPTPDGSNAPDESQRERLYEEASGDPDDGLQTAEEAGDAPGGVVGWGLDIFDAIMGHLYEKAVEEPGAEAARYVTEDALALPETGEGGLSETYEKISDAVKPGAVPAMLLLGYLIMFRGTNYNAAYTAQSSLPKVFVFVVGLGFFPELVDMLVDIAGGLTQVLVTDEGVQGFIGGAFETSGGEPGKAGGTAVLAVFGQVVMTLMLILVGFTSVLKNVIFGLLFVGGPVPMFFYAVPGMAGVAAAWFRAVIACLLLPVLFAAEIGIGAVMAKTPSLVFGGPAGDTPLASVVIGIVVLYAMWQTPRQLLSWAFSGHWASGGFVSRFVAGYVLKKAR